MTTENVKVTVIGAAGGIGQPLSMLIKMNPNVKSLSLYDVSPAVSGVAADLSHVDTPAKVSWHDASGLEEALTGSNFVLIPAGVPRKPGMSRDDLFKINAGICAQLAEAIAQFCPDAITLVISNPVNSTVPVFAEVFKKHGVFNPRKLVGVTNLDIVRSDTFLHQLRPDLSWDQPIKVVGGHSGDTIVPLFSSALGDKLETMPEDQLRALVHRVQYGGDEIIAAKKGAGSSTLSMAYASNRFFTTVLNGYLGKPNQEACAFLNMELTEIAGAKQTKKVVNNIAGTDMQYFALPCVFGHDGVESIDHTCMDRMHAVEEEMLRVCCETLPKSYTKGITFVRGV